MNTKYGIPRVKITKVSEGDILRIREEEAQRAFAQQLYLSICFKIVIKADQG